MSHLDLIRVDNSPVHGKGVYSRIPIPASTYIGTYESEPSDDDGTYVLWIEDDDGVETGWNGINELRFLNHSFTPNAELDGLDLYALRDIEPGEEIFIDYQWEQDEADEDEDEEEVADDDDDSPRDDDGVNYLPASARSGRVTLVSARTP